MKKIKNLLKHKALKNGLWMYLLQFFNSVIPLLTLPYITRVLGASKYGVFSIALNLVLYMQVIVEYGFGMSATRKVALDNTRQGINRIFSGVIFTRLILFLLCFMVSIIYAFIQKGNREQYLSLFILEICLVGYSTQVNWLFQGLQEMKFISLVNIIARTVSVIFIFVFVRDSSDLLLYCFFYAVSPSVSGLLGCLLAIIRYKIKILKPTKEIIVGELKDGWYVFTTQLSSKVFGAIGITLLALFADEHEVGVYSAIQKITNVIILLWGPISQVMYPISSKKICDNYEDGVKFVNRMRMIFLPIFTCIALAIGSLSKIIVLIAFGPEYANKYYWLIPLLVWAIIAIVNNFSGIQILLGSGHDKEYSKCFQISVVCTVLINLFLVYFYKGDGCAIAPMLSEGILFILLTISLKRIDWQVKHE